MKRLLLFLLLLAAPALAQPEPGPKVHARLVAEDKAIAPGGTVTVALEEKIAPGWHTYWKNPGDARSTCAQNSKTKHVGLRKRKNEDCRNWRTSDPKLKLSRGNVPLSSNSGAQTLKLSSEWRIDGGKTVARS